MLAEGHALFDVEIDGGDRQPVIVKDQHRDPVRGHVLHLDLLRVRLDEKIQSTVALELEGVEDAPGVKEGGVLEHVTRELNVEALPTDIPDRIVADVSGLGIAETMTLVGVKAPAGVEFLDDLEETVVATITAPTEVEEPEIEEEAELVGEEGEACRGRGGRRRGWRGGLRRGRRRGLRGLLLRLFRGRRPSAPVDFLLVGLGNPGSRYAGTRHNVGFEVANLLAAALGASAARSSSAACVTDGRASGPGPRVAVLLPQTYMNESGRAVGPGARAVPARPRSGGRVHDEIDLPFGDVRERKGGGLAGHNGLKSLKQHLGSGDFWRVRVGVGRPDSTDPEVVSPHVLARFTEPAAEVRR